MQEGKIIGKFKSKSGKNVLIRALKRDDVAILLEHINRLSLEDTYLLVSGEKLTHLQEERFVRQCLNHMLAGNNIHLLAFVDDILVGTIDVRRMIENRKRALHVGQVGLMIAREYRNDGIGSILLKCMLKAARKMGNMKLLRLWVFGPNHYAKRLYRKFGFELCGSVPESILYRGKYISHDLMYLKLEN